MSIFVKNSEAFEKCREIEEFFSNYDMDEIFGRMKDYKLDKTIPSEAEICYALTWHASFSNPKFYDFHQVLLQMLENEKDAQELLSSPVKLAIANDNGFGETDIKKYTWKLFNKFPKYIQNTLCGGNIKGNKEVLHNEILNADLPSISANKSDSKSAAKVQHLSIQWVEFIYRNLFRILAKLRQNPPFKLEDYLMNSRYRKLFTERNKELYYDFLLFLSDSSIVQYVYAYKTRMQTSPTARQIDIDKILSYFWVYSMCYDDNWRNNLWGDFLAKKFETKGFNIEFVKILNNLHNDSQNFYLEIFCNNFKEYDPEARLLNTNAIKIGPRNLVRDTDKAHMVRGKEWFATDTRLDRYGVDSLYRGLAKMWNLLVNKEFLDPGMINKEIFIYRLSGINCPLTEDTKDTVLNFKGEKTLLGAIVRCLYEGKDEDNGKEIKKHKPPYTLSQGSFMMNM